jgi:hypothetical protein
VGAYEVEYPVTVKLGVPGKNERNAAREAKRRIRKLLEARYGSKGIWFAKPRVKEGKKV